MTDELTSSEYIEVLFDYARTRLASLHVDTSHLDYLTMMTHVTALLEIMHSKGIDGGLHQALAEYSDKFLDLAALTGEMMAVSEGTRH